MHQLPNLICPRRKTIDVSGKAGGSCFPNTLLVIYIPNISYNLILSGHIIVCASYRRLWPFKIVQLSEMSKITFDIL